MLLFLSIYPSFRYNSLVSRIKQFLELICQYYISYYDSTFILTKGGFWLKTLHNHIYTPMQ